MRKLRYREGKGSCLRKVVGETELKSDVSTPKLFLKTFAPGVYLQDDGLGGTFSFFLSFFCIMCKKRSTKAPRYNLSEAGLLLKEMPGYFSPEAQSPAFTCQG